jgi:lipopolysaccharide transport system permease protein
MAIGPRKLPAALGTSSVVAGLRQPVTHVTPVKPPALAELREIWRARETLLILTWRDVKVRYKQTLLGGVWAILQPLSIMAVLAVFLGLLVKVPTDGQPYPLVVICGLVPWTFFAYALTQASNSLVASTDLLTKVYFPRIIIPAATVLAGAVDFVLALLTALAMLAFYGRVPTVYLLLFPPYVVFALVVTLGVGFWLSALCVSYRDVRYTVVFLSQLLFYMSPIAYPVTLVPARFRTLYGLNPVAGLVDAFRAMMLGTSADIGMICVSAGIGLLLLTTGWLYFRHTERTFADVI